MNAGVVKAWASDWEYIWCKQHIVRFPRRTKDQTLFASLDQADLYKKQHLEFQRILATICKDSTDTTLSVVLWTLNETNETNEQIDVEMLNNNITNTNWCCSSTLLDIQMFDLTGKLMGAGRTDLSSLKTEKEGTPANPPRVVRIMRCQIPCCGVWSCLIFLICQSLFTF